MTDEEELEIAQAIGQYQMKVRELLKPLQAYGNKEYCIQVEQKFVELGWLLHHRLEGLDVEYDIGVIPHW